MNAVMLAVVAERQLSLHPGICWVMGAISAIAFGLTAHCWRKNRFVWALGGGFVGLLLTTMVLGIENAAAIPISPQAIRIHFWEAVAAAAAILAGIWWLVTRPLR